MHPLESAVRVKGSEEFSRSELIGILTFRLRLMSVGEAKESIKKWIDEGLLLEEGDVLRVNPRAFKKMKQEEDLFEEMLSFIASSLGVDESDIMESLEEFSKRYGNLDRRLLLYLFGLDKGLDMGRFRDRLNIE